MAQCDYCGSTLVLGGKREGQLRFCNDQCQEQGYLIPLMQQLPPDLVENQLRALHQGHCPQCQGQGPVEVYTPYRIWSALAHTSWSCKPQICCRACGRKSQLRNAAFSLLFGWWGIPWGILLTPIFVRRNLAGVWRETSPFRPSARLERFVRMNLAAQMRQDRSMTKQAA